MGYQRRVHGELLLGIIHKTTHIMKTSILVLLLLITSTVMARPAPDNPLLAFGAGLAVGAVKGKILAGASRPRSSHYSRGRGISPEKAILLAGAAGVGLGLIKAGALNGK